MPAILMGAPWIITVLVDPLANVSVVMIACAASPKRLLPWVLCRSWSFAMILSCGNGSPITPVEAVKIRLSLMPDTSDRPLQRAATDPSPRLPVKALEFPEFTMIAAGPFDGAANLRWQSSTLADRVAEVVNTPATLVPSAIIANITSSRFAYFTPAVVAAKVTPSMTGRSGNAAGARSEIVMS